MKKRKPIILTLISSLLFFTACNKEMDKFYERPDYLQGSAYHVLEQRGQYTLFLEGVERSGYKEMLDGHGLCTVFAPDDEAFGKYLKKHGYENIASIPADSLNILISYHLLKYSYNKSLLLDFRPSGIQNSETEEGIYYKHMTYAKENVETLTDKNGKKYKVYRKEKHLPVFSSLLFQGKEINGEYNYKYFFPNSQWYGDNQTIHVANAGVKTSDIPTDNGYIFLIDEVIEPLRTVYDVLHQRDDYSVFAGLYDKFGSFSYNSSLSSSYAEAGDSLYLYFHKPLPSIYGEETGSLLDFASGQAVSIASQSKFAYNIYAPNNQAMEHFLKTYLPGYSNYDDVPYLPLYYLLSEHAPQTRDIVLPEEIIKRKINSDFGLIYDFDVENPEYREMCSNGPFYGLKEAIVPIVYRSVTGDVLSSPDYKIFTHMLYKTGEMMQLVDAEGLTNKFTLFAVPDAVFNEWGYFYKVDASGAFKEATIQMNGKNISTQEMMSVMDMHIVAQEIKDFEKKAIYETRGGGYLKAWNGGVFGEEKNTNPFQVKALKPINPQTNGITYNTQGILTKVPAEGGLSLNTLLQYDEYREFYSLIEKAGLIDKNGEITLFDQTKFILLVPTNEAIQKAAAQIPQEPEELTEWLKYYIVSLNYNSILSYIYPGIENQYRYGSFSTLTIDPSLSEEEQAVYKKLKIEDSEDPEIFRLRIENNTGSQVTHTLQDEFPVFARDGIIYQIEDIIQPE